MPFEEAKPILKEEPNTKMFAKLKKKIAEEAATAPRTGVRIPRSISKESITSVGADSGDDFVSIFPKTLMMA